MELEFIRSICMHSYLPVRVRLSVSVLAQTGTQTGIGIALFL